MSKQMEMNEATLPHPLKNEFDRSVYPYSTPMNPDNQSCVECRAEIWLHSLDKSNEELKNTIASDGWPQEVFFKKNRRIARRYKGTYALSSSQYVKSRDLRDHVDWLCDWLEISQGLKKLRDDENVLSTISCYWWSNDSDGADFALWPKQLSRLADLQMEVMFHIVYYGDDEKG